MRRGQTEELLGWDEFEGRIRAGRVPPESLVQFGPLTGAGFVPVTDLEVYRALRNDKALAYLGRFSGAEPPVLTALLLGLQIRLWWFARVDTLYDLFPMALATWSGAVFEDAQLWRLLTMGMLHLDLLHIVSNSLFFAGTGVYLERAAGRLNLLVIFGASVLTGSVLSSFFSPFAWTIGSSGGVFGMIAATFVFVLVRPDLVPARRRWFALLLLPYLISSFLSGLSNAGVDNFAHLGGLLCGAVLGALLDPDEIERRPGWNRRVRGAVLALGVATLVVIGVLGPRLEPLADEQVVRHKLDRAERSQEGRPPPPPAPPVDERSVAWSVPSGWRPGGDAVGARGFSSSMGGGQRSFTVSSRDEEAITTASAAAAAWSERVRHRIPGAEVGAPEPVVFGGVDGLRVVARLPGGDDAEEEEAPRKVDPSDPRGIVHDTSVDAAIVELRVATRGVHVLEGTWQVEERKASRLAPLAERLWARVEWREPRDLVAARAAVAARPKNVDAQLSLARELARAGDVEGARAQCRALIDAGPGESARWEVCLEVARVLGLRGADLLSQLDAALLASPVPRTVTAVASTLEGAGEVDAARGLLDIAWAQAPGDSVLKRARRGLGLSNALDVDSGEPWLRARDPVTGRPRPRAEREALAGSALTLADARAAAAWAEAERQRAEQAAVDALRDRPKDAWVPLLVLKDGQVADKDSDARGAVVDDLDAARRGQRPDWVSEALAAAVSAHPEALERLRSQR